MFSGVQRHKLSNGLTVLLKSDHRVPVACVLTWVKAGYFNEPDQLLGISHFIEHMFFKGTPTRGVGVVAKETKELGGYLNAATIYDHTYYYTVGPAKSLARTLEVQADVLLNPLFDPEEMEREKEVIIQELRRKFDNPDPFAWEKLLELAFDRHRIRRWRMGREEDIRRYTRDDVMSYYRHYYSPEKISLAVVGDFSCEEIFPLIEKHYSAMISTGSPRETSPVEEPQNEPRLRRLMGDLSRTLVKMGFHGPSRQDPDFFAMNFLTIFLGRGRSSRFYRSLKEERGLVDGVGASLYAAEDVGFVTFEAELKPEKLAECEEGFWTELGRLRRDPPTAQEIEKVRNIVETNFFSEKEDVMGQAYSLAHFEDLGGLEKEDEYVERMRNITPQDLLSTAEKYFTFQNMSIMEYVPEAVGEGAAVEARLDSLRKRVVTRIESEGSPAKVPTVDPPRPWIWTPVPSDPVSKGIDVVALGGGVKLLHLQTKAVPLATVSAYFPGGRLDETESNCGITHFMLRSSLKGTERRSAEEIAFEMERLGTSIHTEASADLFGYSMSLLASNLKPGLDLLSDVLVRPTFQAPEVEKERTTILADIQRNRDDMFRQPIELFYRALYGVHPYGLPRSGTQESMTAVTRSLLVDWYREAFRWPRMVIAVVGDVERERVKDWVQEHFDVSGDADPEPRAQIFPVVPARGAREIVESRDRKQTGFALGFTGLGIRDEKYFAAEVLRNILSGMGGRLFMELRDKRSLAYTVTTMNIGLLRGGAFFTYMATSPEKEVEARDGLLKELARIKREKPTEEELSGAKRYTQGSHAIGLQSNASVAYTYLHHYIAGRGLGAISEYDELIDAVSAERVRTVANELFDFDQVVYGAVRGKKS